MIARHALLPDTSGPFVADITLRLRAYGVVVADVLSALPPTVMLDMLVMDVSATPPTIPFRSVTDDDLHGLLDRQLYAFVAAVQAAVPRMGAGGAIVLVVPKAYLGAWGGVQIAASAAACVAMARSMAIELAPLGIRVNCVAVGRSGEAWDTPEARGRIAATVAWLAGANSGQITGETLLADRGASLQMAQAARR